MIKDRKKKEIELKVELSELIRYVKRKIKKINFLFRFHNVINKNIVLSVIMDFIIILRFFIL